MIVDTIVDIRDFSTTELQKELERRKKEPELPMIIEEEDQNWSPVIQYAINIRNSIDNGRWDDDYLNCMYSKVMITVFGANYFPWEDSKNLRN
jgi:hypothetical protein